MTRPTSLLVVAPLLASLLVACADDAKRPIGATCESAAQCESGRCVDSVCVAPHTVTPPAVDTLHVSAFKWGVEATPSSSGRLYIGASSPLSLRASASASDDGQLEVLGADCLSDAAIHGGAGADFLRTFAWCSDAGDDDAFPYRLTDAGFAVDRPAAGPFENPLGFMEAEEASVLSFMALEEGDLLEAGGDVFVGSGPRVYAVGDTDGREVELIVAVRASSDASVPTGVGQYGAVRYLASAGVEGSSTVEVDVAAYEIEFVGGDEAPAFHIVDGESVGYRHDVIADIVSANTITDDGGFEVPLNLAADGALSLDTGRFTLHGALSPSGDFFYLGGGLPDPATAANAEGVVIDEDATEAQYEVMLGVRRATAPALASKTYRLMRHEVVARPGGFALGLQRPGGTLAFDASGTTATATTTLDAAEVTHGGSLLEEVEGPDARALSVTVDREVGLIRMSATDGETTLEVFGYAQVGERVLILGDRVGDATAGAVGLSIAVCVNCE